MNELFYAPIRKKYYKKKPLIEKGKCVFCKKKPSFKITENENAILLANEFPYTDGHLLVVSKKHAHSLTILNETERNALMEMINTACKLLKKALKAQGFNVGANIGKVAGESIHHLHFHVIPRFKGDHGFVDEIAKIELVSMTPKETVKLLKKLV
ncbi:MAG: HIT family protein [archaeon]